ncbi:MAG: 4Fe-4S binding protein [Clostridiales bacterium]|nr:4Fe-4S binding protein [Clostridiales bacterium]
MEYKKLGNTGLEVSRLCFGSLTVGPLQAQVGIEEAGEIMAYAFEKGVNFLDAAQLYEVYPHIREGLRRYGKDIIISSKSYSYERQQALDAVDECRKALDRDVIDIFMLHEQESIHTLRGHKPALDALYDLKAKGIIKAVGISTHHIAAVEGAIETGIDVVHPLINVDGWGIMDGSREDMERVLDCAHGIGIGIYTMKTFGGGNLHKRGEECLRYSLSLSFADSIAIGMQSIDEVDANVSFFETGHYTKEQKEALSKKKRHIHIEDWCTGCGECTKYCPQNASSVINGRVTVDGKKCVLCSYCSAFCEMSAIRVL